MFESFCMFHYSDEPAASAAERILVFFLHRTSHREFGFLKLARRLELNAFRAPG